MQLIPVLELREGYPLALRGIAWGWLSGVAALRNIHRSRLILPEIKSRDGPNAANRESSLERKLVTVQPSSQHDACVDPRRRRQPVVSAQIQQCASVGKL